MSSSRSIDFCNALKYTLDSTTQKQRDSTRYLQLLNSYKMGLKEIYLSYDMIEADLIKGLLEADGILCVIRDMNITPYPLNIGKFSEKRITVEEDRVNKARRLIKDAIRDGYISSDGMFKDL